MLICSPLVWLQVLWKLLVQKASPEALLTACSETFIAALFEIAATVEGRSIEWGKLSHLSSSKVSGISSQSADASTVEGSDRAVQIRFDAAEALAYVATAWPAGRPTYLLCLLSTCLHECRILSLTKNCLPMLDSS